MEIKCHILIVDDDKELCSDIQNFLEENGYSVDSADNGKEAIKICKKNIYDIALVDIKLPDISGIKVVEEIRKLSPLTEFIYITAQATIESTIEAVKQERVVSYETKPLDLDHLLSILNEIINRKQSEERMLEIEAKFRAISTSAQDAIVMVDNEGMVSFWNKAAEQIFNYTSDEVIGKRLSELIVPERLRNGFYKGFKTFQDTGQGPYVGEIIELTAIRKDGTEFPIEHSVSAVKINDKWNAIGIIRDVTERKQAEEALQTSEEVLRNILEMDPDTIYRLDQDGHFVYVSPGAVNLGYVPNSLIGRHFSEIVHPDDQELAEFHFNERRRSKRATRNCEVRIVNPEKENTVCEIREVPVLLHATGLYSGSVVSEEEKISEFLGTQGVIWDITERKLAEEKLKESEEKYRELNKELNDFVYSVSHDLKEPLFTIEGFVNRLSKTCGDTIGEKGQTYIDRIKANTGLMCNRIYEILNVAKVGTVTYDFKNNNSAVIVKDVLSELESKINDNNIVVVIQEGLPQVLCDEKRMKDVFRNLLTNAIKFIGKDGQRQIRVGCDKEGNYYKYFVEDTGIGIKPDHQAQIFKIFTRLKDIEAEGTGVGLAIVKKIVELHKGKVWVESPVKEGRGTRFYFTIPIIYKNK